METDTLTSKNRITGLTLQDLLSDEQITIASGARGPSNYPDGSIAEVDINCEKHGTTRVECQKILKYWLNTACPACSEEKILKWEAEEARKKADNERQKRESAMVLHLKNSGIPERFANKGFSSFNPASDRAKSILDSCRSYAVNFPDKLKAGTSLIFCGHAGTGKSHLACAIADHVIKAHIYDARFMKVSKAIRSVKATYNRDSEITEQQAIDSLRRPSLLILDEVGVQYGSDAEKNILFEVINERYEEVKPTILISNLALAGLTEFVGERVIDRMKENGGELMIFDWPSMRGR